MSTKKRFYIDAEEVPTRGTLYLRDRQQDLETIGITAHDWVRGQKELIEEYCDLLNKGHEATEAER